ncbi:MAG: SRPBCC domain-containing protein [Anaerolineae bacterium]|nr:SRPBCC domain-containing protein [Anaerolineae bacterium]
MNFQPDPEIITWRLHLTSSPEEVYPMLSTDEGRARFWAETAVEEDGYIEFQFVNDFEWRGKILDAVPGERFQVEYFGSITTFELESDGRGGTDLTLTDEGVLPEHRTQVIAGWVSVLMALKAAVDFNVDLRNHDPTRSWSQGFVDN